MADELGHGFPASAVGWLAPVFTAGRTRSSSTSNVMSVCPRRNARFQPFRRGARRFPRNTLPRRACRGARRAGYGCWGTCPRGCPASAPQAGRNRFPRIQRTQSPGLRERRPAPAHAPRMCKPPTQRELQQQVRATPRSPSIFSCADLKC